MDSYYSEVKHLINEQHITDYKTYHNMFILTFSNDVSLQFIPKNDSYINKSWFDYDFNMKFENIIGLKVNDIFIETEDYNASDDTINNFTYYENVTRLHDEFNCIKISMITFVFNNYTDLCMNVVHPIDNVDVGYVDMIINKPNKRIF